MDLTKDGLISSACGNYQYAKWFALQPGNGKVCMTLGLNPVVQTDGSDQATAVCIEFAKRLGYTTLVTTNLFSLVSRGEEGLPIGIEPVGADNNKWIYELARQASLIVGAWGDYPRIGQRVYAVLNFLKEFDIHCVQTNKTGAPTHPLAWRQKAPKLYRGRVVESLPEAG